MIKNAVIVSTYLGCEGHGIPSAMINLDDGGAYQGFGGYDLRHHTDFVFQVLDVVEAECWEKLKGKAVRVEAQDGLIKGIGHIVKENWYRP
jgi:hypothetical protein